jgi:hypothetical protein
MTAAMMATKAATAGLGLIDRLSTNQ